MKTEIVQALTDNFEAHAQHAENGIEFWLARDLQHLLGYTKWDNFLNVVSKAKTACEVTGHAVSDHFADVGKTIAMPKGAEKEVPDIMLTRYACYLIAQNGDPKKPLYIQEKVHPKALIDDLLRATKEHEYDAGQITADLFADFNGTPAGADKTAFYQHDQNWTNRMILGDSLQVMASLAEREGLRGKVQCIYFDPPYGIKFNVRHAYFLGANDPYGALKTTLKAEIDPEAWATLNSDTSRPFEKPKSGRIAVKVINHLGDEVMKVFKVG